MIGLLVLPVAAVALIVSRIASSRRRTPRNFAQSIAGYRRGIHALEEMYHSDGHDGVDPMVHVIRDGIEPLEPQPPRRLELHAPTLASRTSRSRANNTIHACKASLGTIQIPKPYAPRVTPDSQARRPK